MNSANQINPAGLTGRQALYSRSFSYYLSDSFYQLFFCFICIFVNRNRLMHYYFHIARQDSQAFFG